ncbi:MAG: kynureninase [Paracoccaceae bacterium]|jgi:kynureninase
MSDFSKTKTMFHLPEGMIYLDGNSLGPLPKTARDHVSDMMINEWGKLLITGWNKANWMMLSTDIGDRIGGLIGAEPGHVITGDTLSLKVYQALASAIELNPGRKVILSDTGNFPSDLYMAQGLINSLDRGLELRVVSPEKIGENLTKDVAVMMITEVDYRTGGLHDMKSLTAKAHTHGVITVWDLAHSAGATDVDLQGAGADFAVGCTYKYLNGGPGSPGFIYVSPKHIQNTRPALSGWLGHEAPFAFDLDYRPGSGIERMRIGTPPVIALKVLGSALDIWDMVEIQDVRAKSIELCDLFITEIERRCPTLTLASPRDGTKRGSQISFHFKEGFAAMQALIARGVIGDFRAPDIMRFGFTPLYIDEDDVIAAAEIIEGVITNDLWDKPEYKIKGKVT